MAKTAEEQREDGMPKGTPFLTGQSGNPDGRPKGSRNLSTVVRRMMDDPNLVEKVMALTKDKDGKPMAPPSWWPVATDKTFNEIVTMAMIAKASRGDDKAANWLRQSGWGNKLEIDVGGGGTQVEQDLDALEESNKQRESVADEARKALGAGPETQEQVVADQQPLQDSGQAGPDSDIPTERDPTANPESPGQSPPE